MTLGALDAAVANWNNLYTIAGVVTRRARWHS
jgi:hypothetical protein